MTRLVRVLSLAEAAGESCSVGPCGAAPTFSVATPQGRRLVCDDDVDALVAAQPEEWVRACATDDDEVCGVPV